MENKEHMKALERELANRTICQVVFETGFQVLILLLAVIGNSCVLYVFYRSPRLRTVTSLYIITLAASDIANAVIIMPVAIVVSVVSFNVLKNISCTIIGVIGYTLVLVSLQTTTMIAVNRFFCVTQPLFYKKHFKRRSIIYMIMGMLCFSIGLMFIIVATGLGNFYFHPGRYVCILQFRSDVIERVITSLMVLVFVVFPTVIAVVCYTNIYKVVKAHKSTAEKELHKCSTLSNGEVDVTRSLLAVVLGFVFCWIPCSIVFQLAVYMDLPRRVEMLFTFSNFVSSGINPILYNIYSKPFRKAFFRIFFLKGKLVSVEPALTKNKQVLGQKEPNICELRPL